MKTLRLALLLVMATLTIWVLSGDLENRIILKAERSTLSQGETTLECSFFNLSFSTVEISEEFSVEQRVGGQWITLNEWEQEINFHTVAHLVFPFLFYHQSYPVSLFSSLNQTGDYRVVVSVKSGKRQATLYCPFSVT